MRRDTSTVRERRSTYIPNYTEHSISPKINYTLKQNFDFNKKETIIQNQPEQMKKSRIIITEITQELKQEQCLTQNLKPNPEQHNFYQQTVMKQIPQGHQTEQYQNPLQSQNNYQSLNKRLQDENDDLKNQIKNNNIQINQLKDELKNQKIYTCSLEKEQQSKEQELNKKLQDTNRQYSIQLSKIERMKEENEREQNILKQKIQELEDQMSLKSQNLSKQQYEISKLQGNITQLACKTTPSNRSDVIISKSKYGNLQWKAIIETIIETPLQCQQCESILDSRIINYLEKVFKSSQEKKNRNTLEKLRNNLLISCKFEVQLCSNSHCQFFCIWQESMPNQYFNQSYCPQCLRNTVFSNRSQSQMIRNKGYA